MWMSSKYISGLIKILNGIQIWNSFENKSVRLDQDLKETIMSFSYFLYPESPNLKMQHELDIIFFRFKPETDLN